MYNRRRAGISTAIALSVLIPFVIIAGCFLVRMREVVQERNSGGQARIGGSERNELNSRSSDPKLPINKTENGQSGGEIVTPRKNSKHEGVYYTNEPLDYYTRN